MINENNKELIKIFWLYIESFKDEKLIILNRLLLYNWIEI